MSAFGQLFRIGFAGLISAILCTAAAGETPLRGPGIASNCDNCKANGLSRVGASRDDYKILNKIPGINGETIKKAGVSVAAAPRAERGPRGDLGQMLATNTISVSSAQELQQALLNAKGGETILLAAGDYGDLELRSDGSKFNYSETVTIASSDENNLASFSKIVLNGAGNLAFEQIHLNFVPTGDTVSWSSAFSIMESHEISVSNSSLQGGPAVNGVPPETPPGGLDKTQNVLGLPTGRAFQVAFSKDITLSNNSMTEFRSGVVSHDTEGLNLLSNEISNLRGSPFVGTNLQHVLVEGNYFHDSSPWNLGGYGDHADMIHIWTTKSQEIANSDIRILGNTFSQGDGEAIMGIYLEDKVGNLGYQDVLIKDNILYDGNSSGFRLENLNNSTISNNTLLQSVGGKTDAPKMIFASGGTNISVINNITADIVAKTVDHSELKIENNLYVQKIDPGAPNYYADLFVNAVMDHAGLAGLQALPGSIIEQSGIGSSLTRFNATPDQLTAIIVSSADEADDSLRHFSAKLTADSHGFVGDADAKFLWDFGDGTTGEGINVSHRYADLGDYHVTLRVVGNGSVDEDREAPVDEDRTEVAVHGPYLLKIDFSADAVEERSGYHSPISAGPAKMQIVESPHGFAYHLTDDNDISVARGTARQIFNLDEFSISFALKRDSSSGGTGDIARVHDSWRIAMEKNGQLSLHMTNDAGQQFKMTTGAAIHDTDWHAVTLDYDASAGTATFYIDGAAVASTHVSGSTKPIEWWGLTVGNPYGANFHGLIDSFEIYDKPLSPSQVVHLHDQLTQLDGGAGEGSSETASSNDGGTGEVPPADAPGTTDGSTDNGAGSGGLETADSGNGVSADGPTARILDYADSANGVTVDLSKISAVGGSTAEDVIGSDSADTIKGDARDNDLSGGNGADALSGGFGHDVIDGGDGDDVAFGAQGDDSIAGVSGADELYGGFGKDHIDGGEGDDLIFGAAGADDITAGVGNDTTVGGSGADSINGGDGDDLVLGASGDDYLLGGAGDDTLKGGSGDDQADGGAGADTVLGGGGQDKLCGGDDDDRVEGGTGNDLVFGAAGNDSVGGGAGHDEIYGGDGDDHVDGGDGNDLVYGAAGNDLVTGGAGNDLVFGGLGDDTLIGGAGDDQLDAGPGADRLVFGDAFFGHDTIVGWEDGVDLLDFSAAGLSFDDFTVVSNGNGALLELTADHGQSVLLAGISPAMIDSHDLA